MTEVYVTTVPLKYEVMAVALTEKESRRLAGQFALKRLREYDAISPDTNTAAKILDYFACNTTRVEIGSACLEGNE